MVSQINKHIEITYIKIELADGKIFRVILAERKVINDENHAWQPGSLNERTMKCLCKCVHGRNSLKKNIEYKKKVNSHVCHCHYECVYV